MDHSSLSPIDQPVLIECLLLAGFDARHFGRCRVSTEQGLCPLQLARQAYVRQGGKCLYACAMRATGMQSAERTEMGRPAGQGTRERLEPEAGGQGRARTADA